jgi:hypothetical protein
MTTCELTDCLTNNVAAICQAVGSLTHSSIRAQGYGTDRWLAGYLGYDMERIIAEDWAAAISEEEVRSNA